MEFLKITEEQYSEFWENHPLKTFLSSKEIGKLREQNGWKIHYVGIKDGDQLVGAAMLLSIKRRMNRYEFYSPRGVLTDFDNKKYLDFFLTHIKEYVKKNKGYVFRMDPYVIYKERDIDGNVVEEGLDHTGLVEHLQEFGFHKLQDCELEQVGWMFSLDLEGKDEATILKEMKPNTRNIIRKAERFGIEIKELKYEQLDQFLDIMVETGARKHFTIRDLSYYQNMYRLFHDKGQIKYVVTELNLNTYIKKLRKEIRQKKQNLEKLSDAKYNDGKRNSLNQEVSVLNKKIEDAKRIQESTKKDIITLSGSMFIMIKPEIIYLSSGNYQEYMNFNSQYLIQWDMIQYGIKNGFKKHNFYGIPANISEKPKDYGIYEFKRGFNGYVEELIGEYELPTSWHYFLFKALHRIRK